MFKVEFHPKAFKEAQELLRKHKKFANQFREFLQLLETEPYKFPKKRGKLRACRAMSFNIDGNSWRLVFRKSFTYYSIINKVSKRLRKIQMKRRKIGGASNKMLLHKF